MMNCCLSLICRTCHIGYLESQICPKCKTHSDKSHYIKRNETEENKGPTADAPLNFTGNIICDAHQDQNVTFYDYDLKKFYCNNCDETRYPKPLTIELSTS